MAHPREGPTSDLDHVETDGVQGRSPHPTVQPRPAAYRPRSPHRLCPIRHIVILRRGLLFCGRTRVLRPQRGHLKISTPEWASDSFGFPRRGEDTFRGGDLTHPEIDGIGVAQACRPCTNRLAVPRQRRSSRRLERQPKVVFDVTHR